MEKLSNAASLFVWNFRNLLKLNQKTIAPILWRPSQITENHLPSENFRQKFAENHQKIEEILKELTLFSKLSLRFPKKLSDADWQLLLELNGRRARYTQLNFWFRKEVMFEEEKRAKMEAKRMKKSTTPVDSFVLSRPSDITESWMRFRRLVESYRIPTENLPILAVDCQFLPHLSPRGRSLTALQLQYLATENRQHVDPFRLHFINYNRENEKVRELERSKLLWLKNPTCFNPIVSDSGVKVFEPTRKVIYLSPDASEELETVENDTVYIIGGIVDRVPEHGIPKQASLEAAQQAGVQARKLPIDRYIEFKSGSRFLTLLAVADILREVNLHGDWQKALAKAIPVRNKRGVEEKSQTGLAAKKRIVNFNDEILRRVDRILGKNL